MQAIQNLNYSSKIAPPTLNIFKIQRTCVYDGPGIRTTIFFRGCNLKCQWCQNPEGQSFQSDLTSDCHYSNDEILEIILRDKEYYQSTDGGVTLSGGEPLLQNPESLIPLLARLKQEKIPISAETTLFVPWNNVNKILPYIDLFLVDLKVVGDEALHIKLTKQESSLIHSNIKKLVELKAPMKFRMVMVPGLNDHDDNIKAAADFLKSIKYDSIELLKYHNLYEDKAKRLNLPYIPLNITPEQSSQSIQQGVELFKKYGIQAINIDLYSSRHKATFTDRVLAVQKDIRESKRSLCIEAAKLRTQYYRKNGFKKPVYIHRAERTAYVLKNKKVIIYPNELLVGNFTSKRNGGHMWEEYYGLLTVMVLYRLGWQKPLPFHLSLKDQLYFYFRIFFFWQNHCLVKKVYPSVMDFLVGMARYSEMVAGFNNNMAAIAHFIPNFDRILELGTTGLIEEVKRQQKAHPKNNRHFYEGAIIALKGLEDFAQKYADTLTELSKKEKDPIRQKELEKMAAICAHVPKYPARTFHEAIQSMLFVHIALCIESYENAISFGRLDQLLYPYYKKDKEAGIITYDQAKELLCLFVLKVDELCLVNDGDSFLNLSNLFETVSTDQAVTFGGVDKDGNDITNDLTYMLIDACELQTLSLDMGARVHKNSPDRYMERIAEAYINGSPEPQLFSDDIYIESILRHYPVTIEQARDYAIVGCVEPKACDDHFGNTDCANVNLPMPFLQALKGLDYNLWNHSVFDHLFKFTLSYIKFLVKSKTVDLICDKILKLRDIQNGHYKYNPPSSMEELLARFQVRLNHVTKEILRDHQKIEKSLRENFPTPLASSLYRNCLETGKDVYEGGTLINSSGIQALGVTDVADSLHAIDQVVFKKKLYSLNTVINAIDNNFKGKKYRQVRKALLSVPKFGDDSSLEASDWVSKVMAMYNTALDSVDNCPRNGRYSAGYYALNVCNRYGKNTPALPSGRLSGKPLANSITPHYGMEQNDLSSTLNAVARVNFVDHAENGATATFHIDAALFQGPEGVKNLASIFKTYLTTGGIQLQPNIINKEILLDAYDHPEKYPFLLVRIAGYCAYFNELSDEMKRIVINRTCYS
jgi:formate C-acetyltransferase